MKKLLILLSVLIISSTGVPSVIAASPYQKEKKQTDLSLENENISTNDFLEFNNKSISKIFGIDGYVYDIAIDNKNNIYFYGIKGAYVLKQNEKIITKIEGFDYIVNSIAVDSKNNIYFLLGKSIYILKQNQLKPIEIEHNNLEELDYYQNIYIDSKDNVYIGTFYAAYVLKWGEKTLKKIEGINKRNWSIAIDSKDNVYFGASDGAYKLTVESNIVTKIDMIKVNNRLDSIAIDSKDNVYFCTWNNGVYVLKSGETTAKKIYGIIDHVNSIMVDSKDNIYFGTNNGAFVLNQGQILATKINGISDVISLAIDSKDNVYFLTKNDIYLIKNNETIVKKAIDFNDYREWPYRYITIDKNDNIYFGSNDNTYFLRKNIKKIFKINKINDFYIEKFVIDSKDNIYFTSHKNGNINIYLLKSDEITPIQIKDIDDNKTFLFIDKNDNIYFGNSNEAYELKVGFTKATKLENIPNNIILANIDNNQNIYFTTNNGIYILKEGETTATKLENIPNNNILSIASDSNNNIYFSIWNSDMNNGIYVLKSNQITPIKIKETNNLIINSIVIDKNDNVYFFEGDLQYDYIFKNESENNIILINKINKSNDFAFDKKNNLYLGTINENIYVLIKDNLSLKKIKNFITSYSSANSSFFPDSTGGGVIHRSFGGITNGAYVLKNGENNAIKLEEINGVVIKIAIDKNNNVYFLTTDGIYFLQNKLNFQDIIKITNLEKIENNEDKVILNELNYLNHKSNYFLNLNKMKIINKTSTSAIIEAIKGKYRGQITINYKIKNKNEISNINLNDLLQKAVYFDFIDKSFYSINKIKEIKNININNLNFGNIETTKNKDLNWGPEFKNVCFIEKEHINRSSNKKTYYIPKCKYDQKSKFMFQITKGINKDNQDNTKTGGTLNIDDENKIEDFININYRDQIITHTLSNDFDFTNLKQQEEEMIFVFNEPEDKIELDPNEKATISYTVRESKYEANLNLKQKINGIITAIIIDDNNEQRTVTLSIKEAMQILQKYSLLPNEITLNEDNSITFNGKAIISRISENKPKLIIKTSII